MGQRAGLSALLNAITPNVYFQPPSNVEMEYPCIVYARSRADTRFAGDKPYLFTQGYTLTVIDKEVDSPLIEAVAALPMCTFSTHFVADNINHDVFDIYF
jgi:hypothetical protein